jgi:hypothetical protein
MQYGCARSSQLKYNRNCGEMSSPSIVSEFSAQMQKRWHPVVESGMISIN